MSEADYNKKIRDSINDYEQTVLALLAFCNEACWDSTEEAPIVHSKFSLGRRMQTSPNNRIRANAEVTPDLVVQRYPDYGLVAEARKDFPRNQGHWPDELKQVEKYDDDLKGWFTDDGYIKTSDVVLLTHELRAVDISDFITTEQQDGKLKWQRKFALVGFEIIQQREVYVKLRKECGELSEPVLSERLRRQVQIRAEGLRERYGTQFYDAKPPIPYLLWIIWDFICLRNLEDFELDKKKRFYPVRYDLETWTRLLQEYYGCRPKRPYDQEIPKSHWVKEALDIFVAGKLADKEGDKYTIRFKEKRTDTLDMVIRIFGKAQSKKKKALIKDRQLGLFQEQLE